jgi:hypothetical protein
MWNGGLKARRQTGSE